MDKKLIKLKLNNIIKNLDYLNKANQKYIKEKNSFELIILKSSMAKFIEEIIENAIKINTIILKENDLFAENYFQSFNLLKEIIKVDKDFLEEISKTTSFRNNIVHNYENFKTQKNLEENIEPIIFLYKKYIQIIEKEINI